MEIKKVAILGAGAVGSYVIEGISGCREIRLGVIAEGERNTRLKECRLYYKWSDLPSRGMDLSGNRQYRSFNCFIKIWRIADRIRYNQTGN